MKTKSKLADYLRRARTDTALRTMLLDDAQFMRKACGWMTLVFAGLVVWEAMISGGWGAFWRQSMTAVLGAVVNLMIFDKFSDRIAMLESMEDQPDEAPEPTLGTAH